MYIASIRTKMQVPSIASLNSFFEIFAAANLAYAGSKTFRAFLSDDLLTLRQALSPRFMKKKEDVESMVSILRADDPDKYAEACSDYETKDAGFKHRQSSLEKEATEKVKLFPLALKSVFLMSGLYCLLVIFACGFCQNTDLNRKSLYICLSACLMIIPFGARQYVKSLKGTTDIRWPRPIATIVVLVLSSIIFPYVIWHSFLEDFFLDDPGERVLFWSTVLAATWAYLLYFIRAFYHKFDTRLRSILMALRHEEVIHDFTKSMPIFVSAKLLPNPAEVVYPKPRWTDYAFSWYRALGKHNARTIEEVEDWEEPQDSKKAT